MKRVNQSESILVIIGDIVAFCVALPLAIYLRDFVVPTVEEFSRHGLAFLPLLFLLLVLYTIAGLYDDRVTAIESVPKLIINANLAWGIIAVVYFYIIPDLDISPKTTLLLLLATLSLLILLWRFLFTRFIHAREKEKSILIGSGEEITMLFNEVNRSRRFPFTFTELIDPQTTSTLPPLDSLSFVVIDFGNPSAHTFLNILSQNQSQKIVDARTLYENVFHRIPLGLVDEAWILSNISFAPKPVYDFLKRAMDIAIAGSALVLPFVLLPFVWVGTKISDKTPLGIFIRQLRVGKNGTIIENVKFRTMTVNDSGKWLDREKGDSRVTPFGKFLRKSRIDELPQLWNVLKGDVSLIGPRPDITGLVKNLEDNIPFYRFRTTIKPGLSGWAQISQKLPPQSVEETRLRLAYDLYYIKNRSFFLDIKIALRTVKTLCSRLGM